MSPIPIIRSRGSRPFPAQGNYDLILAADPTNPNVVYLGGTADGGQTALVRVDTTNIWDAHSLVPYSNFSADGGSLNLSSTGPATVNNRHGRPSRLLLNYGRPRASTSSTLPTTRTSSAARMRRSSPTRPWMFSTIPLHQQRRRRHVDPVRSGWDGLPRRHHDGRPAHGLPRLIFGNDQGVWTILDNNGTFETQVGQSAYGVQLGAPTDQLASVDRNGNLQITQFYYGATQPSTTAAAIAGALFYGSAQDDGGPVSAPNILTTGNITWNGPGGDAAGVGTDQQGLGSAYQFFWPCCGGDDTDFFQYIGPGLSGAGLSAPVANRRRLRRPHLRPAPGQQRPADSRPAVALRGRRQLRRQPGQQCRCRHQLEHRPDLHDLQSGRDLVRRRRSIGIRQSRHLQRRPGLRCSRPRCSGRHRQPRQLHLCRHVAKGQIYVTQDGGGSGTSNNWINISTGLTGAIKSIITDPTRGSHDAYAVTTDGVFYIQSSVTNFTGTLTVGAATVTGISNLTGLVVGDGVVGTGIPAGTTILAVNSQTDTITLSANATVGGRLGLTATGTWVNITSNLQTLAYTIFGQSYNPTTDGNSVKYNQALSLSAIIADWRYQIPFDPSNPAAGYFPALYVGGNSGGRIQSLNNGASWTLFPSTTYGAVAQGGYLPAVPITDLNVALGNVSVNTGLPPWPARTRPSYLPVR